MPRRAVDAAHRWTPVSPRAGVTRRWVRRWGGWLRVRTPVITVELEVCRACGLVRAQVFADEQLAEEFFYPGLCGYQVKPQPLDRCERVA